MEVSKVGTLDNTFCMSIQSVITTDGVPASVRAYTEVSYL